MALTSPCSLRPGPPSRRFATRSRPARFRVRAEAPNKEEPSGSESAESLFAREVRRRGIASSSPRQLRDRGSDEGSEAPPPAPSFSKREQEWADLVQSEGIEGLVPRATELVKLGGTLFTGFVPLLLGVAALVGVSFLVFGDAFIHTGKPAMGPPPYVDPYELLEAEAVGDERVPLR